MDGRRERRLFEICGAFSFGFVVLEYAFMLDMPMWVTWACVPFACFYFFVGIHFWIKDRTVYVKLIGRGVNDAVLAQLKLRTKLQELNIAFVSNLTAAGSVHLQGLPKLQTLNFSKTLNVTDLWLEHIQGLTQLQCLGLVDTEITDAGLEHLTGLTNLQWLKLDRTQITDAGLVHLKGMKKLQYLSISGTKVSNAGLVHLEGLTDLRTLILRQTKVTDTGVRRILAALPKCRVARLWGSPTRKLPRVPSGKKFAVLNGLKAEKSHPPTA